MRRTGRKINSRFLNPLAKYTIIAEKFLQITSENIIHKNGINEDISDNKPIDHSMH